MVLAPKVLIDRYLFNIKVGLFDTLNIFKSLNTNSLTASGKGHRRRKIRPPAAKDRALRGGLGKGPPRARLLPEPYGGKLAQRCCSTEPSPVSLNRPHLSRFPRRTSPGVPELAPPGALPPPNLARCPRIGTTWSALGLKQTVFGVV